LIPLSTEPLPRSRRRCISVVVESFILDLAGKGPKARRTKQLTNWKCTNNNNILGNYMYWKTMIGGRNVICYAFIISIVISFFTDAFITLGSTKAMMSKSHLMMAQITEKEASSAINKVVLALQKDKEANLELGKLVKTNNVLGFGSPRPGIIAVRFNASFQKQGMGRSSIPLPFGLGQSNEAEGRGTMVGQVKASVDKNSGKVIEVSVFRDLGYGRSFSMKI
jgi:hypothetical protein